MKKIAMAAVLMVLTVCLSAEEYNLTSTDVKGDVYATSLVVTPGDSSTFALRGTVMKGETVLAAPNLTLSKTEASQTSTVDGNVVIKLKVEPSANTAVVTVTVEDAGVVTVAQRVTVDI